MAHAARIEDGIVREVIVIPDGLGGDENDAAITEFCNAIGLPGTWLRTSYNAAVNGFRKYYAGIGYTYDAELDEFVVPEPVEVEAVES